MMMKTIIHEMNHYDDWSNENNADHLEIEMLDDLFDAIMNGKCGKCLSDNERERLLRDILNSRNETIDNLEEDLKNRVGGKYPITR